MHPHRIEPAYNDQTIIVNLTIVKVRLQIDNYVLI